MSVSGEWLPRIEVVRRTGINPNTLSGLIRDRRVDVRKGPRAGSRTGPVQVWYVNLESLEQYQRSVQSWQKKGVPHGTISRADGALGAMLARERLARGWTQENVAEALRMTPQRVSKWECGRSVMSLQALVKLAELYDLPVVTRWAMVEELARMQREQRGTHRKRNRKRP